MYKSREPHSGCEVCIPGDYIINYASSSARLASVVAATEAASKVTRRTSPPPPPVELVYCCINATFTAELQLFLFRVILHCRVGKFDPTEHPIMTLGSSQCSQWVSMCHSLLLFVCLLFGVRLCGKAESGAKTSLEEWAGIRSTFSLIPHGGGPYGRLVVPTLIGV